MTHVTKNVTNVLSLATASLAAFYSKAGMLFLIYFYFNTCVNYEN
jgi:hypothetical protein